MAELAGEAMRLCAWEAARDQVQVELRMSAQLPLVYADRVLLEQVLLNLLRNAIDANREQQGSGRHVSCSARRAMAMGSWSR